MDQKYKKTKRRFHDAWAFILFLIATIACNTVYMLQKPSQVYFKTPEANVIAASVLYVLLFITTITTTLIFIPKYVMHAGFFIMPVLSISIAVYFANPIAILIAVVFSAISLALYFFIYKKHVQFSAAVVKEATKMTVYKGLIVIPFVTVCIATILLQMLVVIKNIDDKYEKNYLLYVICILQFYWMFFTIVYSIRVFVSTIIALEIFTVEEEISISWESVKNTMMCMGSICFGSLLIAITTTLRHMHDRSRSRNGRENLAAIIFQLIIELILSLLEEIIRFINVWTFVYMAIYGKSYIESIKGAFDILGSGTNKILINSLCVLPIMNVYSLVGAIGYVFMLYKMNLNFKNTHEIIAVILAAFVVFLVIDMTFSIYDSATKAFLFAYDKEPYSVKGKTPEAYEMLEEQRRKTA